MTALAPCPQTLPPPTVADELADLLLSGAGGMTLLGQMRARFAKASRLEVFFGAAMAISILESERVGLLHELTVAEAKLAARHPGGADGG